MVGTIIPTSLLAVDFSTVPGVKIDYIELDYPWWYFWDELGTPADKYISDPEIVVMPNGYLIASHAWAGDDVNDETSGQTKFFRSTNGGTTWALVSTINGIVRASMFVHNGELYALGSVGTTVPQAVLMKSTNYGTTWTKVTFTSLGGCASPNNPVVFNGRWYSAYTTKNLSAPTTANLLQQASWSLVGGMPLSQPEWISEGDYIGEGQIVASPDLGVFILPKVKQHPYTAVCRVDGTTRACKFDPLGNFANFPGGEKKFGAAYDSVSGKFIALSNPVLPSDAAESSDIESDMIRNMAAMLTSKDMMNWDVEKIFLYSNDERREGYGYLQFDFDGDDLVIASRTAEKIDGEKFPNEGRAHDANCLTFHRLEDFRTAEATQVATIYEGNVKLLEGTPDLVDQNVNFGCFALGDFQWVTANAQALGVDNGGQDIYIKLSNNYIYHFDAFGNLIENLWGYSPVPVTSNQAIVRRPQNESSWKKFGSGDWMDPDNWVYWGRADADDEIAVFGTAINADAVVNVPAHQRGWFFDTTGDIEGWTVLSASATVASGTLSGNSYSPSSIPIILRDDLYFNGSDVFMLNIRMRADANCPVYLYWNTATSPANESQKMTGQYTGNGAWQNVTFYTKDIANWAGEAISGLRFDLWVQGSATRAYSVDWIYVQQATTRIKGMRFNHWDPDCNYLVGGDGMIILDADSGNSSLEVEKGQHTVNALVHLNKTTDVTLASGTTLHMNYLNLYGETMNVGGTGTLKLGSLGFWLSGGKLVTTGQPVIYIKSDFTGLLNGTLEFAPLASFSPAVGQSYPLISNVGALNGKTFNSVILPTLPSGMHWNTSALYTTGHVSITN